MTAAVLLALIYLAFVSLGLPDSILGVSFPPIMTEWNLELSTAGIISMLVTGSTITSSFISGFVIRRLGTAKTTFFSCLLTGGALLGISAAPAWYYLIMLTIPLGIGAGSVDTALNHYVALNYRAHHMNWLHSFWGIGATIGPLVMSYNIKTSSWRSGYLSIALFQLSLAAILFLSMPLWRKAGSPSEENRNPKRQDGALAVLRHPGAAGAMLTMMFYCAAEASVGLWGSSYLIKTRNLPAETAASWMAVYYGGITIGRVLSGFISLRLSNTRLIRFGIITALAGMLLLTLPLPSVAAGFALALTGLGLAPVFPSMLHETPSRFGREKSQLIIGYQMGFGYSGSAFMPPLLGLVLQYFGMRLFPIIGLGFIMIILLLTERLSVITSDKRRTSAGSRDLT